MVLLVVQIRRPNNYDPDVAMMLGPTSADPTMDLTALDIVKTVVVDSPNKLFVGGLPCEWAEDQACSLSPMGGVGTCLHVSPFRSSLAPMLASWYCAAVPLTGQQASVRPCLVVMLLEHAEF